MRRQPPPRFCPPRSRARSGPCRFADTLEPAFEKTKKELAGTVKSDEDVLSYIAFPQVAEKFFAARKEREEKQVKYTIEKVED